MTANGALILDFGGVVMRAIFESRRQTEAVRALAVDPNTVLYDVRDPGGSYDRAFSSLGLMEPHHA